MKRTLGKLICDSLEDITEDLPLNVTTDKVPKCSEILVIGVLVI